MAYFLPFLAMVLLLAGTAFVFVNASAASIANAIRTLLPLFLIGIGLLLLLAGRGGIGPALIMAGSVWWFRNRRVSALAGGKPGKKSTVRSASLEMELDHDSGDLDGILLTGSLEGARLSALSDADLMSVYEELERDPESQELLEAYLDRRISGWRDNTQGNSGARHGDTTRPGPMTKEEAYQILGLEPGAAANEIRQAHRRLMKRVHPDSGGSTFLAARINEAKETLLN